MSRIIFRTADLSNSIYLEELDETFHSRNGALEESMHIFIRAGFEQALRHQKELRILEVGFGTGLNVILTLAQSETGGAIVDYDSIEAFPLEAELLSALHHHELIPEKFHDALQHIYRSEWNEAVAIAPGFTLQKIHARLEDFVPQRSYDLVYFDAFAPDKQPALWTAEIFSRLYQSMNENGILVTYSAKGEVRRNMQQAGFTVERLPGPKGKREILRAVKKPKTDPV